MLNKRQSRLVNRNNVVSTYLGQTTEIYALYKPFQDETDSFMANMGKLDKVTPGKNASGTGVTKSKDELKKEAAQTTGDICSLATSYAVKVADTDLEAIVGYRYSNCLTMKDTDVLSVNTTIYNALLPLVTIRFLLRTTSPQPG